MTVKAGIVCGKCDTLNPVENRRCAACSSNLQLRHTLTTPIEQNKMNKSDELQKVAADGKEDESMEQARHMVCTDCYTPVPAGHKFCGKCGKSLEDNIVTEPEYFSKLQTKGKAKLILIKGDGEDGRAYHLNSKNHSAGRSKGEMLFEDDPWLSPLHANFQYKDDKLVVLDENSLNGIFVAATSVINIEIGTVFMAGEQIFRVEGVEPISQDPQSDGTYFFASPFTPRGFKLVQILEGGGEGMIVHPKEDNITIGREDCDMNFPHDPFISGHHVKIENTPKGLVLMDLGSKNGTFVKINKEKTLSHGDYLFLGRQLLRVEITN